MKKLKTSIETLFPLLGRGGNIKSSEQELSPSLKFVSEQSNAKSEQLSPDNSSPNQGRLGGVLIPTPALPNQGGSKRKCAFTMAEVLITLAVVGVVAVMTLPSVIQKQHEKATVIKVKKMYNVLSQAYLYAVKEYGLPDEWGMNNAKDMRNKLFLNIKKIKNCDVASKKDECGVAGHYYRMGGGENTDLINGAYSSALSDGTTLMVYMNTGNCSDKRGNGQFLENQCGWIYVDVNGNKSPNTYGKDLFCFYLTKYGIIPVGTVDETGKEASNSFSTCKTKGASCTAWVIYNENMDYLHCDDLSWNGKNKCK